MIPPEYAALLPLFIVVGGGALLPILGAFRSIRSGILTFLTVLVVLAAGLFSVAALWEIPYLDQVMPQVTATEKVVSFQLLELTPFVVLFQLVFLATALIIALASPRYLQRNHMGEYNALLLLSTSGMMTVAASRDLITLFVGLELASFCTYALAGFFKKRLDSTEAAMKYFLVGSISSSLALFGISMVYGLTGTTSFEGLAALWGERISLAGGGVTTIADQVLQGRFVLGVFVWVLLLAGFGYKIAFVPFHNYAADVYDGAPSTVGGFLAVGSKHMGFAAVFKVFLLGLFAIKANWDILVGVLAILTMILGNVVALTQTSIKRMLAYSSIAQAGYILMALAIHTEFALTGGLFHVITYAFMQAGAFVALAAAATWGTGEELADWRGMGRRAPFVALSMAVFMLSLAGIPPLAGFASKFVLFSSAINAAALPETTALYATLYLALAIVGILTSAISLVYYWRVIRVMYVEESDGRRLAITAAAAMSIFVALAGTILLGILPSAALELSAEAAQTLFAAIP